MQLMQLNLGKKDLNASQSSVSNGSSSRAFLPDIKTKHERIYLNGPGPGKYSRSSSFGHLNHDVTLKRNPAYSIGKAVRVLDLNANPFYVSYAAIKDTKRRAPGPATYAYEKHQNPFKSSIPAFSIGKAPRFPNYYVY